MKKNTYEASVSGRVISETPTRIEFSFNPFCLFLRQNFAFIWHCLPALTRRDWETPSAMERPLQSTALANHTPKGPTKVLYPSTSPGSALTPCSRAALVVSTTLLSGILGGALLVMIYFMLLGSGGLEKSLCGESPTN